MGDLAPEQEAAMERLRRWEGDPQRPAWPETPEQRRGRQLEAAQRTSEIGCLLTKLVWLGIPIVLFAVLVVMFIWSVLFG